MDGSRSSFAAPNWPESAGSAPARPPGRQFRSASRRLGLASGPFILAISAVLVALSPPAHAQPRSVVVIDATTTEEARAAAISMLTRAIAANPRLAMLAASELTRALSGPLPPKPPATRDDVTGLLKTADEAIAAFDYDRALISLFRAERPLIDQPPSPESRRALADVNFRLGLIYQAQHDLDRTRAAFRAVHFLQPSIELDPARYPPDVIGEFERARPASPDSTLSVSASIPNAAIFVDGRPAAISPAEVEVPAGAHYILVSHTGYRPAGRRIVTQPGGVEPVRIALAPQPETTLAIQLRRRMRSRTSQAERDIAIAGREAIRLTEADAAIVLTTRGDRTVATAVTNRRNYPGHELEADATLLVEELAPAPLEIPIPGKKPWYRRPWTVAAVSGATLATVSVLTFVLLTTGDDMRTSGGLCFPPDC